MRDLRIESPLTLLASSMLFIAHQLPKGLEVEEKEIRVITITEQTTSKHAPAFAYSDLQESHAMTFVNEYVSAQDKARIDFASIPRRPHDDVKIHPVRPYIWTIDRERDVILIWTWRGREENSKSNYFLYVWKGTPMALSMEYRSPGPKTVLWRLGHLYCPEHLRGEYDDMIRVLKEALRVYGVGVPPELKVSRGEVQFDF